MPKSQPFDKKKAFSHKPFRKKKGPDGAASGVSHFSHTRTVAQEPIRLQKYLADLGFGSRRAIEQWIQSGLITVNERIAVLGDKVSGTERIVCNGQRVPAPSGVIPGKHRLGTVSSAAARGTQWPLRVLIYHKPEGELSTRSDPQGRRTVFDTLPDLRYGRWVQVGRLDCQTAGLFLFTNWGELAHRLMHPSYQIEREYAVRVRGQVTPEHLRALTQGVEIEPGRQVRCQRIAFSGGTGQNVWYHMVITEGQNREVRRMWEALNVPVTRLIRVRYGPVELPRLLPKGVYEEAEGATKAALLSAVGLDRS